ncbi:hypothetical protein MTR_2g046940 [Medicago truncatula]|uniref:Uncharacterized protein n=1 Tax=Medicago truncatula TaxID=3880 RepID=A0A072V6S5_MEDTR|nr:hypothetical protein MTR_2g046940 [Medicago truncatula]
MEWWPAKGVAPRILKSLENGNYMKKLRRPRCPSRREISVETSSPSSSSASDTKKLKVEREYRICGND